VGNATDEQVDGFYSNVINSDFTEYDYYTEGSPSLALLSNYSTVIWHDDDLTLHYINDNIEALGNYLIGGGSLLISGWKTAFLLDNDFIQVFTNVNAVELSSGYEFTDAFSEEYSALSLDTEKLIGGFNGTLPFISLFPYTEDAIYTFHADNGSQYEGDVVALKTQPNGTFVLLGIPLYFFLEADVSPVMTQFLTEIGEVSAVEETIEPAITLSAFPNPFNPSTTISFQYSNDQNQQIQIEIYNLKGQRIREYSILNSQSSIVWDGTDSNNSPVTSGIYFYKLKAGNREIIKKMMLVK